MTLYPRQNLLGLSLPTALHTYQWPCKPLVISLFPYLLHTRNFYTYKGFTYPLHMNSLNIFVDFSNLHVFQGIRDLARYAMFSSCVRRVMSSKFKGLWILPGRVISLKLCLFHVCGCVFRTRFHFVVLYFRCMCQRLKTMLWYFTFKTWSNG